MTWTPHSSVPLSAKTFSYDYDAVGNLSVQSNPNNTHTEFDHNNLGAELQRVHKVTAGSAANEILAQYDVSRDAYGRLNRIERSDSGKDYVRTMGYDVNGRLTSD